LIKLTNHTGRANSLLQVKISSILPDPDQLDNTFCNLELIFTYTQLALSVNRDSNARGGVLAADPALVYPAVVAGGFFWEDGGLREDCTRNQLQSAA
jgi:hypothetical protein